MAINNIVSTLTASNGLAVSNGNLSISNAYMGVSSGSITPAQFKNLSSTSVRILDAAGPNTIIRVLNFFVWVDFNTTLYANGSPVALAYHEGDQFASTFIPTVVFTSVPESNYTVATQFIEDNMPLLFSANTNLNLIAAGDIDFTDGDSTINWFLQYNVIPL